MYKTRTFTSLDGDIDALSESYGMFLELNKDIEIVSVNTLDKSIILTYKKKKKVDLSALTAQDEERGKL